MAKNQHLISYLFSGMKNNISIRIFSLLLTVIFIAVLSSCKTTPKAVDSKDLSYLYNPTKNPFNPLYNVYNQSDDSSILSVKFFPNDLYFSEANPQGVPTASLLFSVKLYNISQGKQLADTAVLDLSIVKVEGKSEYVYRVTLNVEKGMEYVAEIKILDKLRILVVQDFVSFNTLSYNNKYNFKAQGHFEKNELFNPVLRINEYINLVYSRGHIDSLFISYYKPFREVPDPPSMRSS